MSHILWGKFNSVNENSESENTKHLYRIRDNDDEFIKKGVLYNINQINMHRDNDFVYSFMQNFYFQPYDKFWLEMTEDERLEHGLKSRFDKKIYSIAGTNFLILLALFAGYQYNKMFTPGGIILRNLQNISYTRAFKYKY